MNYQNNNTMAFSVLMSIWKGGQASYLNDALKSIAESTVQPSEIILVEDGLLGADLQKTIDKWQNSFEIPFNVIKMNVNQGLGVAMRIGTSHVNTEWIARMDADDICLPNRFEKQLMVLHHNPKLAVLGGQVDEFLDNPKNILRQRRVPVTTKDILQFSKMRCPFNHPTVMINKQVLESVGGYQSFGCWEDYYLWERILASGYQVQNLSDVIVHMRVSDDLYKRRGQISNLPYVWRLQMFMYDHHMINKRELISTSLIKSINAVVPAKLRKWIYQRYLRS